MSVPENVEKLLKVFPVMTATCLSSHKIGRPQPLFDLTIIDEAGQCNTAASLMPVARGKRLMLVGDPQQLNPVITLDPQKNEELKKQYDIDDGYDYIKSSIYKSFLANDPLSEEILLHKHYRCSKEIIAFNRYSGIISIGNTLSYSFDIIIARFPPLIRASITYSFFFPHNQVR